MRGIELEGKAEITDAFSVLASYAYTDSEITKANPNAAGISNEGNRFAFVPRQQASLWLDYAVQSSDAWDGLSFGGGARYTGQTFGDNANQFDVPSYTVFDAAVRYDFGKANPKLEGLKASLNVSNIFDKKYVFDLHRSNRVLLGRRSERLCDAQVQLVARWFPCPT